tara:strand:+ start:2477 stop:2809 length:333 start_codon:yes stop_codon:yes gene_type:complete
MIHTGESLKAQDGEFENYHYQLEDGERYQLTSDELNWLSFVRGRYCIYDHIMSNSECDENNNLIYTMDTYELSRALCDDTVPLQAVCLSDKTALQSIFFYSSYEIGEDNE